MESKRHMVLTSESACDLPDEILKEAGVNIIHYYVHIGGYDYQSETEINSENILEHMEECGEGVTVEFPAVAEYRNFFEENISGTTPLLHLLPHFGEGKNKKNAGIAAEEFEQVTVFETRQYSGGLGVLLLAAVREAEQGKDVQEISACLRELETRMNSSLLVGSSVYKKKMRRGMRMISELIPLHPVLRFNQGEFTMSYRDLKIGGMQDNYRGYIRSVFRHSKADPSILVFVHAGCGYEQQQEILQEIEKYVKFERVVVCAAGAAFVCAFGGGSISLQFLNET